MLLDVLSDLAFEPFCIDRLVDERRRYQLDLDPRFPLAIKPLSFDSLSNPQRFNWHERLELFICAAGRGRFRMGDRTVRFAPGDVLVVDNLKLHGLEDCYGAQRLGVVVNFMPELVCSPVSYPCDSTYLVPFYFRLAELEPVLRATDPDAADVQASLGRLLKCYFTEAPGPRRQAGCKAHLLQALYYLAKHFGVSDAGAIEFDGWRRQSLRFGRLYEYLRENYADPITVAQAGEMVGLSQFRFMKFFKKTTGMTFVTYLTNLRLSNAHRLLTETSLSIAEIAATIGFADQSYFDRRFRMFYKQSPRQVRTVAGSSK